MKAFATLIPAAALAAALAATAAPASAAVIASFSPDSGASDYRWINDGGAANTGTGGHFFSISSQSSTLAQGVATHFQFLDSTNSALGFIPATFTLDATVADGHPATTNASNGTDQTNVNGSFSFVYSGASTANFGGSGIALTHGEVLLSGIFSDARIQGGGGSGSANLAHINGGSATFSSALLDLSHASLGSEEFAFNLLSATPNFSHNAGAAMASFRANGGGNFSANVPEPATWGLMIVGFGGLGVMARRRRSAVATA